MKERLGSNWYIKGCAFTTTTNRTPGLETQIVLLHVLNFMNMHISVNLINKKKAFKEKLKSKLSSCCNKLFIEYQKGKYVTEVFPNTLT